LFLRWEVWAGAIVTWERKLGEYAFAKKHDERESFRLRWRRLWQTKRRYVRLEKKTGG